MTQAPIVHHIPVCPFSQRLEILLALKGRPEAVRFRVVDVTRPRDPALLAKTGGSSVLPVLETADGRILKESLVLLRYLDETVPGAPVRRADPAEHAVEQMLIAREGPLVAAGYGMVMNQDPAARPAHLDRLLAIYRDIDAFLTVHAPDRDFLFPEFGLAEAVFAPLFQRFHFLDYYEGFAFPGDPAYARVRRWHDACRAHPAAQQVGREEIVKLYHDYARGLGNGALGPGRTRSSFAFAPHWRDRPWPPADKYGPAPTDRDLGLV